MSYANTNNEEVIQPGRTFDCVRNFHLITEFHKPKFEKGYSKESAVSMPQ